MVTVNQSVFCNGFPCTVIEVCTGQLQGMCVVRLARGCVCVDIDELIRFNHATA